tara:strand:- start:249 stop:506 length:258 start_codon:yes stop_codon:yes gene_type:complete
MIDEIEKALAECTQGDWQWARRDTTKRLISSELMKLHNGMGVEICDFGNDEQYYPTEGAEPTDADALIIANATKWLRYMLEYSGL